jgi:hypothetical protein
MDESNGYYIWEIDEDSIKPTGQCKLIKDGYWFKRKHSYFEDDAIVTGMGRIDLKSFQPGCDLRSTRNLFVDGRWVVRGGERILLLPRDYEPQCAVVTRENILIMGHNSGVVTFLGIGEDKGEK